MIPDMSYEEASLPNQRDGVLAQIAEHSLVWVRLAAVRDDSGGWRDRLIEVTSGTQPPGWEPRRWEYPCALLLSIATSGAGVADAFRDGSLVIGEDSIPIREIQAGAAWERRQSRGSGAYEALDWPSLEYAFSQTYESRQDPNGHLISAGDAPTFLNFYTAVACFFWLDRAPMGGSLNQSPTYRHQDLRARINSVAISDEDVTAEIEGEDLEHLIVELAGDSPGQQQTLWPRRGERIQTVRFRTREGVPPGAWLVVRDRDEWIDRRFLNVTWAQGIQHGVEVVTDPGTRLEAILASREGMSIEFKERVPNTSDNDGKWKVMKTVCAFANGDGGSLVFGVDDDRTPVGISADLVDGFRDQMVQTIGTWVEPRPRISFDTLPIQGRAGVVLEMQVESGLALYGARRTPGDVPRVYVRHPGVTEPARPGEIEAIMRSRQSREPDWLGRRYL